MIAVIPRILFYLHQLRRNLRLKPSEMQRLQLKRLKYTIKYAYEHVPFYHRKFKAAGFNPDDFKALEDLQKIPVTTKLEVQSCNLHEMIAKNADLNSLIKKTTSGSTGIPLTTLVDERISDFEAAIWMRALCEDGLRLRDKMAVVADPRSFPKKNSLFKRLGVAKRQYISIFDPAEKQLALLRDFKPDAIKGYPSSLAILAKFNDTAKELKPRLVFTSAELLDTSSRKLISSAFVSELFDFYACSEFSLLAWECREHSGYHVNADSVLIEFLDENKEAVTSSEKGKTVCTSLFNNVMPLIRYELNDIAVPVSDPCPCGTTLPLIKLIEGRADDFLVATDGRAISPTVFFPYPFEDVDWIRGFRIIQESRKKLVVQIAAKNAFADHTKAVENAERKIRNLFGEDMEVKFEFVREILPDLSGKIRKVVSHVNRMTKKM